MKPRSNPYDPPDRGPRQFSDEHEKILSRLSRPQQEQAGHEFPVFDFMTKEEIRFFLSLTAQLHDKHRASCAEDGVRGRADVLDKRGLVLSLPIKDFRGVWSPSLHRNIVIGFADKLPTNWAVETKNKVPYAGYPLVSSLYKMFLPQIPWIPRTKPEFLRGSRPGTPDRPRIARSGLGTG
jgi:hypothetical protein